MPPCRAGPPPVVSGGEEPGGGDVGAELGQGPGLVRALEGAGGGGGPVPDPGGGVGREVGREPGHAVPVRGVLDPPVRGALGVACFDADRVVAFTPRPCLGPEPARGEVPGRAAAGRVRRGGVQEVRLQRGGPGGVQAGGFVDDDPGVLQEIAPACRAARVSGRAVVRVWRFEQEGCGGSFADGQDAGDLGDDGHLLGGVLLRGRRRRCQGPGRPGVVGGQPAPSAPRTGPPSGRPRRARPGNHPPDPAADRHHAGNRRRADRAVRAGAGRQPARRRTRRRPPGPPCSPRSRLSCSPYQMHLRGHRQFSDDIGGAATDARTAPARSVSHHCGVCDPHFHWLPAIDDTLLRGYASPPPAFRPFFAVARVNSSSS